MESTKCGICKIASDGTVLHKNSAARASCPKRAGDKCSVIPLKPGSPASSSLGLVHLGIYKTETAIVDSVVHIGKNEVTVFTYELQGEIHNLLSEEALQIFTKTEKQIIEYIVRNQSNKLIAQSLFISQSTLKTHLNHMYKKAPLLRQWRLRKKSA